jgi:hypothetical protein
VKVKSASRVIPCLPCGILETGERDGEERDASRDEASGGIQQHAMKKEEKEKHATVRKTCTQQQKQKLKLFSGWGCRARVPRAAHN